MQASKTAVALLGLGLLLGGCMQSTSPEPMSQANLSDAHIRPHDRLQLARARYAKATIPEPYRRHVVNYQRKELPGTIVVDTDAKFLYYVLPDGKAVRYGVTVGEDALSWSGVARVGRLAEWPDWVPTAEIKQRMGDLPNRVPGGIDNPLGARGIYLYEGNRDTLFRIHGTNQPEYIGRAISSGCIRMTNEDVIELYDYVKTGSPVVVLAPGQGMAPGVPQVALQGGRSG